MAHWPAAAFGDVCVHALQRWIAFGSIDESCHESRERLLVEQRFGPADELDQVGTEVASGGQGEGT